MNPSDYTHANRLGWNEVAPRHAAANQEKIKAVFAEPDGLRLNATEKAILERIDVRGKAVAQLCCNNGQETISVKRLGAARAVGFDIADQFIAQAKELEAVAQSGTEFVCSNIYDIPEDFNNSFDVIYITIGVLSWMPDLGGFFDVARRLMKPDAQIFIYEMHPILNVFDENPEKPYPSTYGSYFSTDPVKEEGGLDYYEYNEYEAKPVYWFPYTLGMLLTTLIERGIQIAEFKEYPKDISNIFPHFETKAHNLPLSYTLIGRLMA